MQMERIADKGEKKFKLTVAALIESLTHSQERVNRVKQVLNRDIASSGEWSMRDVNQRPSN